MSYSQYPGGPGGSGYPGAPQSSYPGGPQSSYPGGPQSAYPGGPQSSYPGGPGGFGGPDGQQSSYPGGPGGYAGGPPSGPGGFGASPSPSPGPGGYQSPPPHGGDYNQRGDYNSNLPPAPYGGPQPGQNTAHQGVQYDAQGNPVDGERGLGTMALGAGAGFLGNKMTGGHMGNFTSIIGGAIAAQVGKKLYDKKNENQHNPYGSGGYGGPPPPAGPGHHGGGGFFNKF